MPGASKSEVLFNTQDSSTDSRSDGKQTIRSLFNYIFFKPKQFQTPDQTMPAQGTEVARAIVPEQGIEACATACATMLVQGTEACATMSYGIVACSVA